MTSTLTREATTPKRSADPVDEAASSAGARFDPGEVAICRGEVHHRRTRPAVHEFTYPVSYVWLDPDRPEQLCGPHPLWSARRPAPARFRRRDYGISETGSLAEAARDDLAGVLGRRPTGSVRMLTQIRRWGWLFNPITVYLVWDADPADDPDAGGVGPVGAVLEVTNTPWKERIRYPIALDVAAGWWRGRTDKVLHVSPFLDEDHGYEVRMRGGAGTIELDVDVVPRGMDAPIVLTALRLETAPPTRRALGAALRSPSTHRVSLGIHREALRLWWKRVPFVPHPAKRSSSTDDG